MLSRLLVLLSILSFLLLCVTGAAWIRSYSVADRYAWGMDTRETQFKSSQGCFRFARVTLDEAASHAYGRHATDPPSDLTDKAPKAVIEWPSAGIVYGEDPAAKSPYSYWILPYWLMFLLFAILPAWWLFALRKEIMGMFGK